MWEVPFAQVLSPGWTRVESRSTVGALGRQARLRKRRSTAGAHRALGMVQL